jgi:NAD(P)-dependent dehydrogenase (short-subunit alcohol dehydrogenase family)
VVVAARRVAEGSAVVQELLGKGGTARFVETDITQQSQVTRAVESTVAAFGRLDCAVNVPGITGQPGPLADCTDDNWAQVLHLNPTAFFWCLRAELQQMRAQGGGGRIVNVSSAICKRAFRGLGPYGATKRALESLTETAALEVASEGV